MLAEVTIPALGREATAVMLRQPLAAAKAVAEVGDDRAVAGAGATRD